MRKLSAGELDLIQWASEGGTYPSLARARGISMSTINSRLVRGFAKLGVHSMPHAVALCMSRGLIPGPLVCDGHE